MPTLFVTGSSGLVGSECVRHFAALGWIVHGADNNLRQTFFGKDGDTSPNLKRLRADVPGFVHHVCDVRNRYGMAVLVGDLRPDLIIHAAGQPSHDLAANQTFVDFDVNAGGTLNLLEAVRHESPGSAFCFLSTNKVYGDAPNYFPDFFEGETRHDTDPDEHWRGFDEGSVDIDQSTHSLFGVSKLAADLYTQEYGRYFGLKTVAFRCGCLTGGAHAGAEQHGFLAYLAKCCREGFPYTVYGYKGKQVRDQLHGVDVARACEEFYKCPRPGEVYNLGGGRENSVSVLEAIDLVETATGKKLSWTYVDEPRKGDHVCWITDTGKFCSHYPDWDVSRDLAAIIAELCGSMP